MPLPDSPSPKRRPLAPGVDLDFAGGHLRRNGESISLRPKAWLVLCHLSERPGQLLSVQDLLDVAWPGTAVSPSTLTNVVNEIRRALGDDASEPTFVQTVFARGYRWIAEPGPEPTPRDDEPDATEPGDEPFVGRADELMKLRQSWAKAVEGRRTTVFLGGDAGIGKTRLTARLADSVEKDGGLVARGAAVETHGLLEPFLPFFTAIDDLLSRERSWLLPLLERCAPGWLAQMPWTGAGRGAPPEASSPSSMLSEGAALWEAIAAERPVLLVLEDLHLADTATVGLFAYLTDRTSPARLMMLGTGRTAEAVATEHPVATLIRKFRMSRRATVLPLSALSRDEIQTWLSQRFSSEAVASSLAPKMERLSEGNPLFLAAYSDHAIERGVLRQESGVWTLTESVDAALGELPGDLRGIVDAQLEVLGPELTEALEAASAAGLRFVAQDVASGIDRPCQTADALCHRLAQSRHFVRALGEVVRPDGTRSGEYEFIHSLYRQACYERLAPAHRQLVHQRIALGMEKAFGSDRREIAYQLAAQFEAADDIARSVDYLCEAAAGALQRHQHADVNARLAKAREQLERRPQSRERDLQEIAVHRIRGMEASADLSRFKEIFAEAYESGERLALRVGEPELIFATRMGVATGHNLLGRLEQSRLVAEQLVAMARDGLPTHTVQALAVLSYSLSNMGELERSAECLAEAVQLEPAPNVPPTMDFRAWSSMLYAYMLAMLGHLREADEWVERSVTLGEESGLLASQAVSETTAADLYTLRRDFVRAGDHLRRVEGFQTELLGAPNFRTRAHAALLAGAVDGATEWESESFCRDCDTMDTLHERPWGCWPLFLVAAQRRAGRLGDALRTIDMGFRHSVESSIGLYLSELHRERGEIAMLQADEIGKENAAALAEAQFREAIRIAGVQHARLFELRATNSLVRLLGKSRRRKEAMTMLKKIATFFENERGTDVDEARALLEAF